MAFFVELIGPPEIAGERVTYPVHILEGSEPVSFGAVALFIDAIPRPVDGQGTDSVTQVLVQTADGQVPTEVNPMITD